MSNTKTIEIGTVMVDSGQLMIVDPCYLSDWDNNEYIDIRLHKDINTGEIFQYGKDFPNYEHKLEKYNGKTPNSLIAEGIWISIESKEKENAVGEFSYNGACVTSMKPLSKNSGNLANGMAAVFRSGFGDGRYKVTAKVKNFGDWGDRITQVTIKLIED